MNKVISTKKEAPIATGCNYEVEKKLKMLIEKHFGVSAIQQEKTICPSKALILHLRRIKRKIYTPQQRHMQ